MPSVYETKEYKDYSTDPIEVPLTDLTFDEQVADMIEERNCCFPDVLLGNIYDFGTYKLDNERLDRILEGYNSGVELPPINIKKGLGTYIVVNGRHRVCAAILNNRSTIRCVIIDE